MSLASDLSALALARATKAALSASLPPCPCGSGAGWVAGKGGTLVCGECGGPVPVPTEIARVTLGSGAAAGLLGVEENAGAGSTHPSPAGMVGGEGGGGSLVEGAVEGPGRAGMRASGGPAVSADAESANRTARGMTDPDDPSGGPQFSDVTIVAGVARGTVPAPGEVGSAVAEVGVLRGKVTKQRKGTVEFYEDAKAAHRMSMRSMKAYIRRSLRGEGGVMAAMQDPAYRWCVEQVGKFAHSQAPKEIKAETRLLIEFDMQ